MGDIADMMLDGTLCEGCGVYLPGNSQGIPRKCHDCKKSERLQPQRDGLSHGMIRCKKCGKVVKEAGLYNHMKDKHGNEVPNSTA